MSEGYTFTRPFTLTCPECGGALFPPEDGPMLRYVCHIGHELNWPTMVDAQLNRIEASLATAMVVMKERAELARQIGELGGVDPDVVQRMILETIGRAEEVKKLLEQPWIAPEG